MSHSLLHRRFVNLLRAAQRLNTRSAGAREAQRHQTPTVSRRALLRAGATVAGGAALSATTPGLLHAAPARVAVVGAGIAGLSAAHHLQRLGHAPILLEAGRRPGGRMHSARDVVVDGLVTDFGGAFVNSNHADMHALADAAGVSLVNIDAVVGALPVTPGAFHAAGGRVPEAVLAERLRPLAARIAEDASRLDADWEAAAAELDALSVEDYLARHHNAAPADIRGLVASVIRSEYGVEPERSSALQLIFTLPAVDGEAVDLLSASDEMFMVEGGSGALVAALADRLDRPVEYGRRLTRIEPAETGHRLIFADGSAVKADATIVTVPVTALRGIVFDVPLPDRLAEFAQEVSLGHNEKVFAGFDGHPWRRPGGFGSDVWTDGPAAVAWDNSVRQPDLTDGALTLFTGGRHAESLGESGAFARAVLSALDPAFLGLLSGMNGRTARTNWGATRGLHGAYTSFAPGQLTRFGSCFWIEEDGEAVQEVRAGNLAFAGEHLSDAFYGYMNGGAETGRLAAHSVTRALAR